MKRLIFLVATLFLLSDVAVGCTCYSIWMDEPKDTEEQLRRKVAGALRHKSFVFTAEVAEFVKPDPSVANTENPFEELTKLKIRFKVKKVWKGELADEIIMSGLSGEYANGHSWQIGCAYSFKEGKKYLIYASGPADDMYVHLCSRTKLLDAAEREIEILDGLKQKEEKPRAINNVRAALYVVAKSNNGMQRTRNQEAFYLLSSERAADAGR